MKVGTPGETLRPEAKTYSERQDRRCLTLKTRSAGAGGKPGSPTRVPELEYLDANPTSGVLLMCLLGGSTQTAQGVGCLPPTGTPGLDFLVLGLMALQEGTSRWELFLNNFS